MLAAAAKQFAHFGGSSPAAASYGNSMMSLVKKLAILLPLLAFSSVSSADELAILTGGTSSVYYPVGVKLQEVLEREIPDHTFKVLSTQATVENLNLLQRGSGILALAQGDILSDAWEGNPEAGFPSSRTKIRLVGGARLLIPCC